MCWLGKMAGFDALPGNGVGRQSVVPLGLEAPGRCLPALKRRAIVVLSRWDGPGVETEMLHVGLFFLSQALGFAFGLAVTGNLSNKLSSSKPDHYRKH
jgi:hypothetical protein